LQAKLVSGTNVELRKW